MICHSGDGHWNCRHPCGCQNNQDHANYEENKLGMTYTDGIWIAYCGKCNTWSCTSNAHNTDLHDAALLAGASYHLPTTYPFNHHCSSNNNDIGTLAPVVNITASVKGRGIAANDDFIQVSKSKATQILFSFQTSNFDANIAALVAALWDWICRL